MAARSRSSHTICARSCSPSGPLGGKVEETARSSALGFSIHFHPVRTSSVIDSREIGRRPVFTHENSTVLSQPLAGRLASNARSSAVRRRRSPMLASALCHQRRLSATCTPSGDMKPNSRRGRRRPRSRQCVQRENRNEASASAMAKISPRSKRARPSSAFATFADRLHWSGREGRTEHPVRPRFTSGLLRLLDHGRVRVPLSRARLHVPTRDRRTSGTFSRHRSSPHGCATPVDSGGC